VTAKRSHKQDRLAKVYDAEILPIWAQRFGRMLLRKLTVPPKAMVLDVGAGTGYPALEVLRRMDDHSRIISIDPSSAMLDVAREKAGALGGKRIFFRSESVDPRLSFTADVFDVVISNLTLQDLDHPAAAVSEFARVAKPGGRVIATFPLAGTFAEFFDLYREVLTKADRNDALERLERHIAHIPTAQQACDWFEAAGLTDVHLEHEEFLLLFRSSREFFFAPVIEYGPLAEWKVIAGKGEEMQGVFWRIKETIDAYFGDKSFGVTVRAACIEGRKPLEEERSAFEEAQATEFEPPTGEHLLGSAEVLGTGEFEVIDESVRILGGGVVPAGGDEYEEDEGLVEEELLPPLPGKGARR
jgi:ubiquinone/menaquinone biosynthesis C-methylase UbiE